MSTLGLKLIYVSKRNPGPRYWICSIGNDSNTMCINVVYNSCNNCIRFIRYVIQHIIVYKVILVPTKARLSQETMSTMWYRAKLDTKNYMFSLCKQQSLSGRTFYSGVCMLHIKINVPSKSFRLCTDGNSEYASNNVLVNSSDTEAWIFREY